MKTSDLKSHFVCGLGVFLLLALLLLPRMVGIDRFVAVDEPNWLTWSANFYYALGQRDFQHTFYEYHPGVTTMWVGTVAMVSYFPEYRGLGQGYFGKDWQFFDLLSRYGKTALGFLQRFRLILVSVTVTLLLLAFLLLRYLLDRLQALMIVSLIALDPYFLGHSRLLNHEGLLATFLLLAILSMLVFLYKGGKIRFLILSAACAGLAALTKSPAILALPLAASILAVKCFQEARENKRWRSALGRYSAHLLLWVGVAGLVYFIFWPGMWVNPGKLLYQVFGNAISYASQGHRLSVTSDITSDYFSLDTGGLGQYAVSLLWKTTPVLWAGVLLAGLGLISKKGNPMEPVTKITIGLFGLLALAFVLLFGLASGRNSLHYILTSFVSLEVITGIGLVWAVRWLGFKYKGLNNPNIQMGILTGVLLIQGGSAFASYPYYYTYTNPIMQSLQSGIQNPGSGYGEGLELAAAYLSHKPDPGKLKVFSWYGIGPFSFFFPGKTYTILPDSQISDETVGKIEDADYLVIYYITQKARDMPKNLLAALAPITPEHVIWLNGIEYIRIYKVDDSLKAGLKLISQSSSRRDLLLLDAFDVEMRLLADRLI